MREPPGTVTPAATAVTFARLKTLLLLRTLARGGVWGIIAFTISATLAIGLAIAASSAVWIVDPVVGTTLDVAIGGATLVGLVAVLGPLIGGGIDDTIAPAKLALLPLRTPALIAGSALAAVIGPWPAAGIAVVTAATLRAAASSPLAWVLVPVAVVLTTATFVALSRTVVVGLSTLLRRRLLSELASLVTVAIAVGGWALSRYGGEWFSDRLDVVGAVAGWTPLGLPTAMVGDVAAGRWGWAGLRLAISLGAVGALLALWNVVTQRALTTPETAGRRREARPATRPSNRPAVIVRPLPERPWGAIASRVLHELGRNPRRRVALVMSCLPGVFLAAITVLSGSRGARDVFVVVALGVFLAAGAQNLFGFDGAALWADIASGDRVRALLFGFTVALAMVALPVLLAATVALAAVTRTTGSALPALIAGIAALGGSLGVFCVASAFVPAAIPEEPTNAWTAKDAGKGCLSGIANLVATGAAIALAVPPVIAAWVSWHHPAYGIALLPLTLAWGAGLWWAGIAVAARRVRGREPELLTAVSFGRD